MTDFLIETLVWTAVLLAVVLAIRRPVARWFGPQLAYALWLLPLARLVIPPITLPAWLAPQETATAASAAQGAVSYEYITTAAATAPAVTQWLDWSLILLAIWLVGAAVFLCLRFSAYFKMRTMLLDNAIPVGEEGNIRLVESAATPAPLAFGVFDRVIALPEGFMASADREARDLALEHELTHHRGGDLLINFAIQPLFALHWFNPLGYAGWRAMRRDQEAACDARVVANRGAAEKATYGEVIANFAAAPTLAPGFNLAAPMACPVLGDKSIIQRLRSLTMSDISPRRRFAGRFAIGAAVLALPLTASISYAESLAPAAPLTPEVSAVAPTPPVPPVPPIAPVAAMLTTDLHPETGDGQRVVIVERTVEEDSEDGERRVIIRRHSEDGEGGHERRLERRVIVRGDHDMSDEEIERIVADAESHAEGRTGDRHTVRMRFDSRDGAHDGQSSSVTVNCSGDGEGTSWTSDSGQAMVAQCTAEAMGQALTGLRTARDAIAGDDSLSAGMKAEVLRELDTEIAKLAE